ncbi:siroheme decarboxylase subunit beta [Hydrogenophilus thermoluteolus]|uniref:siroheme decarboxylase n=1 Tax=Hydrogenophilus thermoluteolus TaxID=297 RepID=A0A2Z6DXI8_HYDTE|nr:Lrp/AsnC family transcriptional regulator [Hydrogenophilus thermoluteolus]BBD77191.1 heme d1 biosynthesis protein NirD/L [Hydrogenophilus thermoluteolus]
MTSYLSADRSVQILLSSGCNPSADDLVSTWTLHLVNAWQRGFPLVSRPFAEIAKAHGASEAEVRSAFCSAKANGWIDRIGPVWAPRTVGWSTLAAAPVPAERLHEAGSIIARYPEINHNYARSGAELNLWFVLTAPTENAGRSLLVTLSQEIGAPIYLFPLVREYHIDLGFDFVQGGKAQARERVPKTPCDRWRTQALSKREQQLFAILSEGLPLVPQPYRQIAEQCGCVESDVVQQIAHWLAEGTMRRFGAVVRHRALGWTANAMAVWAVPPALVDELGVQLAAEPEVHLCYRREPVPEVWPYTLYAMVHGSDSTHVAQVVSAIQRRLALDRFSHRLLFSTHCFKQTGARYVRSRAA